MSLNASDNQTDKKAPQVKEKTSHQAKQRIEKPEKFEKSEKTRKKNEESEREVRVTRRQHSGLGDNCSLSRIEEWLTKARPQSDHLL